jgi:hypothetical protein
MISVRHRLRFATCALLAVTGTAAAESGDWHFESGALRYSEQQRVAVFEPLFSLKRDFSNDRSLTAKTVFDVITGASPTGASPTNQIQTVTSSSGKTSQSTVGTVPTNRFRDRRAALDLDYAQPLARTLKLNLGGEISTETDYQSRGSHIGLAWDTPNRLTTFSAAFAGNFDRVNPRGGLRIGLDSLQAPTHGAVAGKRVYDGMIGITQVLSPRWLAEILYGQTRETGYLTEPYKIISVLDAIGNTVDFRNENRPDSHLRHYVEFSSAGNVSDEDVIHVSYRYFWDDWGIRSHTVDVKYRFDLSDGYYLEPHLRFYGQSAADFFTFGLLQNAPLPRYATADYRYGKMNTNTIGAKLGIPFGNGELNFRLEYMLQSGSSNPSQAIGMQKQIDLFPPVNITIVQVGYAVDF